MRHGYLRLALTLIVTLVAMEASAQSIDRMRSNLAVRTMDGTHVRVDEDEATRQAVSAVESKARPRQVNGYRVVIYSDNGQYAGDKAKSVHTQFRHAYPHINAYLVYESPYFKVSVGDCLTMEEAQILMAELSSAYPKAFPKREVIKLSELQHARAKADIVADTTLLGTMPEGAIMGTEEINIGME